MRLGNRHAGKVFLGLEVEKVTAWYFCFVLTLFCFNKRWVNFWVSHCGSLSPTV